MRIVRPTAVTEAVLLSTDVPETDLPVWNSATAYTAGQQVMLTTGVHRKYQALQDSTNKNPGTEAAYWVDIGPSNRWALFDSVIGTLTSKAVSFTYVLQFAGLVDSLCFLNVEATEIYVKVEIAGIGVVYETTSNMLVETGIDNWYDYYFEEIERVSSKSFLDLPNYLDPKITITVTNTGGNASVGCVIPGRQKYLGRTQYGTSVGIIDYSKKEKDDYGNYRIVERPYSDRGSFNVMVDSTQVDAIKKLLTSYRATAILYLGTDCYESTSVYGFYKDFTLVFQHMNESQCNIEVEGVT